MNEPPFGTNLSCGERIVERVYCSSGTTGSTLWWADSAASWEQVAHNSFELFQIAGVRSADRVCFAMPFRSSSGPWIMFHGVLRLGCACFTPGETEPKTLWTWVEKCAPTILIGKPLTLLSLAAAARKFGASPWKVGIEKLILTGQPSRGELREKLGNAWGAECFDRYGLTEAGSVASECDAHPGGMHVLEEKLIPEVLVPGSNRPVDEGEPGELVLTNTARLTRAIVRYRTGDRVRLVHNGSCDCGRMGALLMGDVVRLPSVH